MADLKSSVFHERLVGSHPLQRQERGQAMNAPNQDYTSVAAVCSPTFLGLLPTGQN